MMDESGSLKTMDKLSRQVEALEQIAKWDKRSQSETVQQFAKAALTPAGQRLTPNEATE